MLQHIYFVWYFRRPVICPSGPTSGFLGLQEFYRFVKGGLIWCSSAVTRCSTVFVLEVTHAVSGNTKSFEAKACGLQNVYEAESGESFFWIVE